MTKKRIKTSTSGLRNPDHFHRTCDEIAELDVKLRAKEAARDTAIQQVRDVHEPEIGTIRDRRDALVTLAEDFAFDNRDELFPIKAKSGETNLAFYGLRYGQPTLKTINRKWTWAKVLEAVRGRFKGRFIRSKEELDKDGLKAQLGDKAEVLASIGCRITQTESFWIEPKESPTSED